MSTKLERIMHIDSWVRGGAYPSAKEFCERFEISERTAYDDVSFMKRRLSAPLEYSRTRGGYYYADLTWILPTFQATEGQLLAFFLSIELAHRYLGTHFEEPLREAVEHLESVLPDQVHVSVSELAQHYTIRAGATAETTPETLVAMHQAIEERHPVEITYFTAGRGEETQRIIHPYHLLNIRGEWHLLAYDLRHQKVRQFALPRFRAWNVLRGERFEIDASFSLADYLGQSFQFEHGGSTLEVVVAFDEYQARYIRERQWHESQRIEELPGGGLTLRFITGALGEVQRWVMGYGSHARVLAPPELAQAIAEELRASLAHYENPQQTATILQSHLLD